MKEMNKTYAIVEVIEGEQIQLVRKLNILIHHLVWLELWHSGVTGYKFVHCFQSVYSRFEPQFA